jgi:hypothetical protein
MKHSLKASFQIIKEKWPVHVFMYLVSLVLSAIPFFVFYQILEKETGQTLLLNELVPEFNFMVFGDFLNASGKAFKPVFWYSLGAGFIGSLVYTFFSGGVIDELANSKRSFKLSRFFKQSAQFFPKFLGLLIVLGTLLFVLFLVSGLIFFIFASIAHGSTERGYFFWLLPPSIILFIFMSFGLVVSFYAKVFIYKESRIGFVTAFWEAFYYVFRRKETVVMFWGIGLIGVGVLLVYIILDKFIGMRSGFTIVLFFVLQQILILSKFVLKHWNYAVALDYFQKSPVELYKEPNIDIAEAVMSEELIEPIDTATEQDTKLSDEDEGL